MKVEIIWEYNRLEFFFSLLKIPFIRNIIDEVYLRETLYFSCFLLIWYPWMKKTKISWEKNRNLMMLPVIIRQYFYRLISAIYNKPSFFHVVITIKIIKKNNNKIIRLIDVRILHLFIFEKWNFYLLCQYFYLILIVV